MIRTRPPLLIGSAVLLGVAGIAAFAAALIRWAPCADYEHALQCAQHEDHLHDYVDVAAPFDAIGGTLEWAAVCSSALLAFWLLWAIRSLRAPRSRMLAVGFVAAAVVQAWIAGAQLFALATGLARGPIGWPVQLLLIGVYAVPAVAVLLAATGRAGGVRMPWLLLVPAAVLQHPVVDYVVMIRIAGSHDTPPGSGYLLGAGLLLGAASFGVAAAMAWWRLARAGGPVHPR